MHAHLEATLAINGGVVLRREHPELAEAIKRECRKGTLTRVLCGAYLLAGTGDSTRCRAQALTRVDPDAVITGLAAAHLTWWPELQVTDIEAYRRTDCQRAPGFRWRRGLPPPELVHGSLAHPALQVLDLIPVIGPGAVDEAFRRRATSLATLHQALELTPGRPHNQLRRKVLTDSRDEPWSEAEREFHRVLRAERITGWRTNYRVRVEGRTCYLDVALPDLRLGFEVDGFEFHGSRSAFERDRGRDALLAAHEWQVVRISAAEVAGCGEVVKAVIAARATVLQRQPRPGRR